ncbi:hypothetical protein Sme01_54460 [Sphaerisporangium melleum]|uniref:Uncharacterized protein n=1 Tax=Sphaerisporangium melleum TaxID=321316 RepID=A0A917VL61_9ACTN|nr:hypothetical protein GCM10007964_38320 [Sphaerisporangium melleum]GII72970.1 hypothetical protein Sme01_54460 [Sphaerisporangium melleum]
MRISRGSEGWWPYLNRPHGRGGIASVETKTPPGVQASAHLSIGGMLPLVVTAVGQACGVMRVRRVPAPPAPQRLRRRITVMPNAQRTKLRPFGDSLRIGHGSHLSRAVKDPFGRVQRPAGPFFRTN